MLEIKLKMLLVRRTLDELKPQNQIVNKFIHNSFINANKKISKDFHKLCTLQVSDSNPQKDVHLIPRIESIENEIVLV